MAMKHKNQVENVIALILLGLIICGSVYLTILLFFSPSVP